MNWIAKQQSIVALSSTEAEYIAMTEEAKEIQWFREILDALGVEERTRTQLLWTTTCCWAAAQDARFYPRI